MSENKPFTVFDPNVGNRPLSAQDINLGNVSATLFTGPLVGNVTGNVAGNVTGDVTGNITASVTTVAAAGGNISTAAALLPGVNFVTGADDAKGVVLPVAPGQVVVVVNTVANKQLKLYPPSTLSLNGGVGNASVTMGNGSACQVYGNATNYYTVPTLPS